MTDEEQKRIFAQNLNYFISISGKNQKEVAEAIGFQSTTFNTWCKGKILPTTGKIQKIADYFGIGKADLLDNRLDGNGAKDADLLLDSNAIDFMRKWRMLAGPEREAIMVLIDSLIKKKCRLIPHFQKPFYELQEVSGHLGVLYFLNCINEFLFVCF